eukprot:1685021-Rhodomonas_salina.1
MTLAPLRLCAQASGARSSAAPSACFMCAPSAVGARVQVCCPASDTATLRPISCRVTRPNGRMTPVQILSNDLDSSRNKDKVHFRRGCWRGAKLTLVTEDLRGGLSDSHHRHSSGL